jgi:hypothetical protein
MNFAPYRSDSRQLMLVWLNWKLVRYPDAFNQFGRMESLVGAAQGSRSHCGAGRTWNPRSAFGNRRSD